MKIGDKMHNYLEQALNELLKVENDKLAKLDRVFHLLEELTKITDRTILWLIEYCNQHDIPLWNEKQLVSYIRLSEMTLKEIEETSSDLRNSIESRKLPRTFFDDENPDKLPEPSFIYHCNKETRRLQS